MSDLSGEVIPVIRTPYQKYVLKDEDEQTLKKLHEEVREASGFWYTRKNPQDAIDEIRNSNTTQNAKKLEVYQSLSLSDHSDKELITTLKHREASIRAKAISILSQRLHDNESNPDYKTALLTSLKQDLPVLVQLLNDDIEVIKSTLNMLVEGVDQGLCVKMRQIGGIPVVCKLLTEEKLREDEELLQYLIYLLLNLSQPEENRDAFRSGNGLIPMVKFLEHPTPRIRLMVTRTFLNLSYNEKNQPVIVSGGALDKLFENMAKEDDSLKIETIFVIRNLLSCAQGRESMNAKHLSLLVDLLSVEEAYTTEELFNQVAYKKSSQMQKMVLTSLAEASLNDRNKLTLGQLQLIDKLKKFFMPMSAQSGLKWNFQILEKVLLILDHLITIENLRNDFLDSRSFGLIARILQSHDQYTEDCVLTSAQIATNVASHATTSQRAHADNSITLLLNLFEKNSDAEFIQNLISHLFRKVAEDGHNKSIILDQGATKILINFLKESSVKDILINCVHALADLSTEDSVNAQIIEEQLIPTLIGLLKLNLNEMQHPIVDLLVNVVKDDESATIFTKSSGITTLSPLLNSKSPEILEGVIIVFAKVLFHKDTGESYRKLFFESEGDVAMIKILCDQKTVDKVLSPCLSVLSGLSQTRDGRRALLKDGLMGKIDQLEREGRISTDPQYNNLLKVIKANLKKEEEERLRLEKEQSQNKQMEAERQKMEAERLKIENLVKAVQEQAAQSAQPVHQPKLWLKADYEGLIKRFPVTLELTYQELVFQIVSLFNIETYENLTWTDGNELVALDDQGDLNYILDHLTKGGEVLISVHPKEKIIKKATTDKVNKLDPYLKELTPKQLRDLLKLAISQGADIIPQLKQYVVINRQANKNKKTETVESVLEYLTPFTPRVPPNAGADILSPRFETPPTSPFVPQRSQTPSRPLQTSVKATPPPPPPAPSLVVSPAPPSPAPSPSTLRVSAKTKPPSRGSTPSKRDTPTKRENLLESIKSTQLKKIEDSPVIERKGREGFLTELKQKNTQEEQQTFTGVKMLNQGMEEGKKYWIKQPERYIEELRNAFMYDYHMIQIILDLTQSDQTCSFSEQLDKMNTGGGETKDPIQFAQVLLAIGFNLRYKVIIKEGEKDPITEYTLIYPPSDLPISIIIKTIIATIKGLPDEYVYEIIEDISFVPAPLPILEEVIVEDLVLPFPIKKT